MLVDGWPFLPVDQASGRPFVLQHALKYLLLVAPIDRFQGFARLIGLDQVEALFRSINRFCTKPQVHADAATLKALSALEALEIRIAATASLKKAFAELKRGAAASGDFYKALDIRADSLLPASPASPIEREAALISLRFAGEGLFRRRGHYAVNST
jgi:hypothetical protein